MFELFLKRAAELVVEEVQRAELREAAHVMAGTVPEI